MNLQPQLIEESELVVQIKYVGKMPFVDGPGLVPTIPAPNLGSPVTINNKLHLIDHNDAIYRLNGNFNQNEVEQIFSVTEAPDELLLDNRESILNITQGSDSNSIYVVFTSDTEPNTGVPIYRMPEIAGNTISETGENIPIEDLYRIGTIEGVSSFFGTTRTGFQVIYEYELAENKLQNPVAITAFEIQIGPTHTGGGMLTLPDGNILFATGDALPFGTDGRNAPQDLNEHIGKLLIINPDDGTFEVAAQGVRNVQHLNFVQDQNSGEIIGVSFADIGGVTAEEVNYISLTDLLDTSIIENFRHLQQLF